MGRRQIVYVLLFLYIGVSLTYEIANSVFLISYHNAFNPRHEVQDPFQFDFETGTIRNPSAAAKHAGIVTGDRLDSINGVHYTGLAQYQRARWDARAGDVARVGVRHPDGSYSAVSIPFEVKPNENRISEQALLVFFIIVVPLFCLSLGYWVALARPGDPNAWFILVILSYPEIFNSISTSDWPPGFWLAVRLYWHLIVTICAPAALFLLGLFFPERSRIDVRVPWLKLAILVVLACALGVGLATEYALWYDHDFIANAGRIDAINAGVLKWSLSFLLILYWIAIVEKLSTASSADSRRRLRVLCVGSTVGLGSMLVVFGLLPWFGIPDPTNIQWVDILVTILMLTFPLTLAYVVIVQRALDVRVLVRMGTKYALARTTLAVVEIALVLFLLIYFVVPALQMERSGSVSFILPALAIGGLVVLLAARDRVSHRLQNWLDRRFFREAYNAELILSELAERARTITDVSTLIETVSRRISEVLHIPQVTVFLRKGETFRLQYALGVEFPAPVLLPAKSLAPAGSASKSSPVIYSPQERLLLADEDGRQLLQSVPAETLLVLPGRTRPMGLMTLGPKLSEEAYSPSDLRLLESVAVQTGLGLEVGDLARSLAEEAGQRERMEREIEIASEVQQRLLPQCIPSVPGIDLAGSCRPALGVGGDYYDMFQVNGNCVALALGDVSGKGISAALLMASLRASLRSIADDGCKDLAHIVTRLNKQVHEASAASRYATFFFAIYQPDSGELRYVNAGHNPPFVIRGCDEALRLETGGMVVGLLKETSYEEGVVQLEAGDLLLAYTDGISEAMTAQDEEWGEHRMLAAAEDARPLPAEEILRKVMEAADSFTGAAPQHDDMTLMVLKVESVGQSLAA